MIPRGKMSVRNDISGLLGFIGREHIWQERLQDVVAEHLMPALEEFEVEHDELADLLGHPHQQVRLESQYELASRKPDEAATAFTKVATD